MCWTFLAGSRRHDVCNEEMMEGKQIVQFFGEVKSSLNRRIAVIRNSAPACWIMWVESGC